MNDLHQALTSVSAHIACCVLPHPVISAGTFGPHDPLVILDFPRSASTDDMDTLLNDLVMLFKAKYSAYIDDEVPGFGFTIESSLAMFCVVRDDINKIIEFSMDLDRSRELIEILEQLGGWRTS
jgi:hypothetical protein